jgi:hypothetical protein
MIDDSSENKTGEIKFSSFVALLSNQTQKCLRTG